MNKLLSQRVILRNLKINSNFFLLTPPFPFLVLIKDFLNKRYESFMSQILYFDFKKHIFSPKRNSLTVSCIFLHMNDIFEDFPSF